MEDKEKNVTPVNSSVTETKMDNYREEIARLREENENLKAILSKESQNASQESQACKKKESYSPNISTNNRFEALMDDQHSTSDMDTEEDFNKRFSQILKEKNSRRKDNKMLNKKQDTSI